MVLALGPPPVGADALFYLTYTGENDGQAPSTVTNPWLSHHPWQDVKLCAIQAAATTARACHRPSNCRAGYVLAPYDDAALSTLISLLTPFGIQQFYTDRWGAYLRSLQPEHHTVGKTNTQRIERKHLTLRTQNLGGWLGLE